MPPLKRLFLDFYGTTVCIESSDSAVLQNLERDFRFFVSKKTPKADVKLSIFVQPPPYASLPPCPATIFKRRCTVFECNGLGFVDYFGLALAKIDRKNESYEIFSMDRDLLHEIPYELIQTRAGELLDKRGYHRIHALGLAVNGKAVLLLLPITAGKTSLAMRLLKKPEVKLISEDTPLFSPNSRLLAYPLRFGIKDEMLLKGISPKFLRHYNTMEAGKKTLADIDIASGQIQNSAEPAFLLLGRRVWGETAEIKCKSRLMLFFPIFRDVVIGLGVAQLIEYFVKNSFSSVIKKIPVGLGRGIAAVRLVLKSKTFEFTIGNNHEKNAAELVAFLEKIV